MELVVIPRFRVQTCNVQIQRVSYAYLMTNYLSFSFGNPNIDTDELYLLLLQPIAAQKSPPWHFLLHSGLESASAISAMSIATFNKRPILEKN